MKQTAMTMKSMGGAEGEGEGERHGETRAVIQICENLVLHGEFGSARLAAQALCRVGTVAKAWHSASRTEVVWQQLYLRTSPAALFSADRGTTIFTPFTALPDIIGTAVEEHHQELYRRRLLCAEAAEAAHRPSGEFYKFQFGTGFGRSEEQPMFVCTTPDAAGNPVAAPAFSMSDVSYTFELFELVSMARTAREVNQKALNKFCGPPHFAHREGKAENLLWCSTTRMEPGSARVCVAMGDDGRLTIPIDAGMDDYMSEWCCPWRLVVTAKRDTDNKICQIVDVRGEGNGRCVGPTGFKEIGQDTSTAGIDATVCAMPEEIAVGTMVVTRTNQLGLVAGALGADKEAHYRIFLRKEDTVGTLFKAEDVRYKDERGVAPRSPQGHALVARLLFAPAVGQFPRNVRGPGSESSRKTFAAFEGDRYSCSSGMLKEVALTWIDNRDEPSYFNLEGCGAVVPAKDGHLDWVATRLNSLEWH